MSDYVDFARSLAPDDWDVQDGSVLICPCGYAIEWDGECPEGHVSFLREKGFI